MNLTEESRNELYFCLMLTEGKGPLSLIPAGFSPHYKIKGRCFCTFTLEGVNPGHSASEIGGCLSLISLFHRWVHSVIISCSFNPALQQTAKATNLQCIDLLISHSPAKYQVSDCEAVKSFWIWQHSDKHSTEDFISSCVSKVQAFNVLKCTTLFCLNDVDLDLIRFILHAGMGFAS